MDLEADRCHRFGHFDEVQPLVYAPSKLVLLPSQYHLPHSSLSLLFLLLLTLHLADLKLELPEPRKAHTLHPRPEHALKTSFMTSLILLLLLHGSDVHFPVTEAAEQILAVHRLHHTTHLFVLELLKLRCLS